jgi:hypothetical protein
MRFIKNLGRGIQKVARGLSRGISTAEGAINAIDKATGGALRSTAAIATGGLSEAALKGYNRFKKPAMGLLKAVEKGEDPQKSLSEGVKLGKDIYRYAKTKPNQ